MSANHNSEFKDVEFAVAVQADGISFFAFDAVSPPVHLFGLYIHVVLSFPERYLSELQDLQVLI